MKKLLYLSLTIFLLLGSFSCNAATSLLVNEIPVANAGVDITVKVGEKVTLDASGSRDPENRDLEYNWHFVSAPQETRIRIYDVTTANPYFSPDVPGQYVALLFVSDGTTESAPDKVVITAVR